MATGKTPRLLPGSPSWEPQIAPVEFIIRYQDSDLIPSALDTNMAAVWLDLKHYDNLANTTMPGPQTPPALFLQVSTSVPNRLLHLKYDEDCFPELLRLCMLAYVKSILFRVPGIGMHYLSEKLEFALRAQRTPPPRSEHASLVLWALFIYGVCIVENFDQVWHREALLRTAPMLGILTWDQCKSTLSRLLWIDNIHDGSAESGFKQVFGQGMPIHQ